MKKRKRENGDDLLGFMKGKAKIVGNIQHSVPLEDWNLSRDDKNKPRTEPKQHRFSSQKQRKPRA